MLARHEQTERLRLPVAESGRRDYRLPLYDVEGEERLTMCGLRASGTPAAVTVTLAADSLPRGDYELRLVGVGHARAYTYPFRVTAP